MLRPLWVDLGLTLLPLALAGSAWLLGRHLRRLPRPLAGILGVLALLVVPLPFLRYVPAWCDGLGLFLHHLGGTTRLECGVALFLLGVAWAAPRKSLSPTFLAILTTLVGLVVLTESAGRLWWRFAAPSEWRNAPNANGLVTQSTGMTCSAAAHAMLLHHHGITASEGELAYLSNTSLLGTTFLDMADALRLKLEGTSWRPNVRRGSYDAVAGTGRPFVAGVDLPGIGGHAVFVLRVFPADILLADPLGGSAQRMKRDDFERSWDGTYLELVREP